MQYPTDKRQTAQPPAILQGKPIKEASRQMLIGTFSKSGRSIHSRFHGTLAYIIDYCETYGIPYRLTAVPGEGYIITK